MNQILRTGIIALITFALGFGIAMILNDPTDPTDPPACTTSCYAPNTTEPFPGVTGALAKALVTNYRQQQWTSYQQHSPNHLEDARSVWFSLAAIKRFIHEIERSACSSCPDNRFFLGVRIYYGTYPAETGWKDTGLQIAGLVDPMYANYHTVLMVPTYYDEKKQIDIDFDPFQFSTDPCRPQPIDSNFNPALKVGFLMPVDMMNHGTTLPPPPPPLMYTQGATFACLADGCP